MNFENPKRHRRKIKGRAGWYGYYAGYCHEFVKSVLSEIPLPKDPLILDPWNGSGTTTTVAFESGFRSIGLDLNPVMGIVAKAKLLGSNEVPSIIPLLGELKKKRRFQRLKSDPNDPLACWISPCSVVELRKIEAAIQELLIPKNFHGRLGNLKSMEHLSDLTCFFYLALFNTIRKLLERFVPTNPTWMKRPIALSHRVRPSRQSILEKFEAEVLGLLATIGPHNLTRAFSLAESNLLVGSSQSIPLDSSAVDLVVSSPPYCTRIDYAMATISELALLGLHPDKEFDDFRRSLIGSSTVPENSEPISEDWGVCCLSLNRSEACIS